MLDIFLSEDMNNLLKDKYVVFLGDSNIRALYKDFLCLLTQSTLIPESNLKAKMEQTLFGDKLISNGARHNGRSYREERFGKVNDTRVSFYFLTQIYNEYVDKVLDRISSNLKPDVLVINCLLWDITRWGAKGVEEYKKNLRELLKRLQVLFPGCLVVWVTTPPISSSVTGGFLVKELQFLQYSLRFHVMEANHYARKVVVEHGFDLLDSHYHLKMQIHRRTKDGVHWSSPAVRYITNLLLTHISLAWNIPLPHRYDTLLTDESLNLVEDQTCNPIEGEAVEQKQVVVGQEIPAENKNKENYDATPKPSKKQRKKKRPNPNQAKPKNGNSHHHFMNKVQHKERQQRIRKWQSTVQTHTYEDFTPEQSPSTNSSDIDYQSQNNSYYHSPNDSGYVPSPAEASLSNESFRHNQQRNISFDGLVQSGHKYNSLMGNPNSFFQQQSYSLRVQRDGSFAAQHTWGSTSHSYNAYRYSSWGHFQNGGGQYQRPYMFPHVAPGQNLQPQINFASDDFMAF